MIKSQILTLIFRALLHHFQSGGPLTHDLVTSGLAVVEKILNLETEKPAPTTTK